MRVAGGVRQCQRSARGGQIERMCYAAELREGEGSAPEVECATSRAAQDLRGSQHPVRQRVLAEAIRLFAESDRAIDGERAAVLLHITFALLAYDHGAG